MSTRSLPLRPNLDQLKRQAQELKQAHRQRQMSAAARIAAHHPRMTGLTPRAILDKKLTVADAQLVIAREYGLRDWTRLKHRVEQGHLVESIVPHPRFGEALAAFDAGDLDRLRAMTAEDPSLVHARSNLDPPYGYFSGAMLLHYIAGNPGREHKLPANVLDMARLLLESGADPNASTLGPNGGPVMSLVITSKQASDRDVSGPLIDLLLAHGAALDLGKPTRVGPDWPDSYILDLPLANHAPRAAEKLIALGARVDVCAAAALGRLDLLRDCFDETGALRPRCMRSRARHGTRRLTARDNIGLALLFAYVRAQPEAVDFLIEQDGNWDMVGVNNGAVLHRAAFAGDLPMVQRLVAKGADIHNRDNPFNSTPLSWAQHNKRREAFDWIRTHCAIDLHDAAGFNLLEETRARLRDDPASVHERRDQWEIPHCTALHWVGWPTIQDVDGAQPHDPAIREAIATLLLDHGADPSAVAGNGLTPLDVAVAGESSAIAALLVSRGGTRAAEL